MLFYTLSIVVCYFLSPSLAESGDDDALILTPYIKKGNVTLARNLSRVDSSKFLGLESYSGFITVKEEYDSNLFFWYFPHAKAKDVPWVIWLQGGPGVTSLLGTFDGIGPFKIHNGIDKDPTLTLKNSTWAADYSLLFVDNPVGAGFSYTKDERGYTDNEEDIGEQLLNFLVQFLQVFPELQQAPLFLAGQSYSGKYLPAFGSYIHNRKNNATINLRGISIGNGLIDPKSQMTEGHSKLCDSLGLLSDEDLLTLTTIQQDCVAYIDTGRIVDASNKFNESIEFIKKRSGVNIYNFNKNPSSGVHPLEPFVEAPAVRAQLHVGRAAFNFNNQRVYTAMLPDIMNSTKPFLEELLEHYGVMCYTGQLDVILPHALAKPMYAQFRWSRRGEYERARRRRLRSADGGNVVAYRKAGGNFIDVVVRNAGHMVAGEQPEVLKFIMGSFISEFK